MLRKLKIYLYIVLLSGLITNLPLLVNAANFDSKFTKNEVKEATKLLKKIKVTTETEQDRVNVLFGGIS